MAELVLGGGIADDGDDDGETFLFATVLSNAPAARDRLSLCVSRSELDRLTL